MTNCLFNGCDLLLLKLISIGKKHN